MKCIGCTIRVFWLDPDYSIDQLVFQASDNDLVAMPNIIPKFWQEKTLADSIM